SPYQKYTQSTGKEVAEGAAVAARPPALHRGRRKCGLALKFPPLLHSFSTASPLLTPLTRTYSDITSSFLNFASYESRQSLHPQSLFAQKGLRFRLPRPLDPAAQEGI